MDTPQEAVASADRSNDNAPPPAAVSNTTPTQHRPQKKPPTNLAPTTPSQVAQKPSMQAVQQKKVHARSSKPFINWFQRKLAGSGKAKRTENLPLAAAQLGSGRSTSSSSRQIGRIASSPLPVLAVQQLKQQGKPEAASLPKRKTRSISLNGDEELRDMGRQSYAGDDDMSDQSSINRDSLWSPASALEADDDASLRPLPPSAPPSPSPSRDSSSYLSDPRTFRSIAASTKPTTLLSIDLNGGGMAHIAQAPPAQATQLHRFAPHVRQSSSLSGAGVLNSGTSITFSALPNPQSSSRPSSIRNPGSFNSAHANAASSVQAPLHTAHHPRNNPRPSSPPLDNASVLTLASSAFALPSRPGMTNYPSSAVGDSVSHYGGGSILFPDGESTSHYVLGDDERLEERDFDASVRALRPRSSRRGSWESEASRWSARVQSAGATSLVRERSLWTSNSIRTGGFSTENGEGFETADDQSPETATREIGSDKGSILEPAVDIIIAPPEDLSTSNDHSVNIKPEDDDISSTASGTTGVDDTKRSPILHRTSTETIAGQPPVSSEDTTTLEVSGEKVIEGKTEDRSMAKASA